MSKKREREQAAKELRNMAFVLYRDARDFADLLEKAGNSDRADRIRNTCTQFAQREAELVEVMTS